MCGTYRGGALCPLIEWPWPKNSFVVSRFARRKYGLPWVVTIFLYLAGLCYDSMLSGKPLLPDQGLRAGLPETPQNII